MKKNRVLFVQPLLPIYSIDFFNEMVREEPSLDLVVSADLESTSALNQVAKRELKFKAIHLKARKVGPFTWINSLFKKIEEVGPDLVVFSGNPRDLSQLFEMIRMKLLGRKFYVWGMFHKIGRQRVHTRLYYKFVSWLSERVFTYTRVGARNLVSLGVPQEKISVIGTAIDERIVREQISQTSEGDLRKFSEEQRLDGKKVILQVVRLSAIKKPSFLIDAAAEISRRRSDVVFVLIGDGDMRQELEVKIKDKKLESSVKLLGAIYDEEVLSKWYLNSDAFVMPTCIGLSAHHAMAYGLPIVTDNSLAEQSSEFDILANGLNSIIYEAGSVSSLVSSLEKVLDNPALAESMSRNAKLTVYEYSSIEKKAENMLTQIMNS